MKSNYLATTVYAVITTLLILAFEWGINVPVPEISDATLQSYQLVSLINSPLIPLVGIAFAVFVIRMINKRWFYVHNATTIVLVGGLLFLILKPLLALIQSTWLALLAAIAGMIIIFFVYQAAVYYARKSATI